MPTSIPGMLLTSHTFTVPLDHDDPQSESLALFVREVVAPDKQDAHLPYLVFFQGGPGFASPRPPERCAWLPRALQEYRVLLLDQRGTGNSTPLNAQTLARFTDARAMADYLKHFRADSIVRDAEWLRTHWLGGEKWSVLGQSFGGFCVTHYLSTAPHGLREAIITGGLPPLGLSVDEVYRATYARVLDKNRRFFERYPEDAARAQAVADYLATHRVTLPTGDPLSVRRFQQLGLGFGASDGFETVHYLLERAFVDTPQGKALNYYALRDLENAQSFDASPLYAILHEGCFCDGVASRWAAERVRAELPEFQYAAGKPFRFTGEMVYPWMFDEFQQLRPLREAAHLLAEEVWTPLYDPNALAQNEVPAVAALYYDDMYVDRGWSAQTAARIKGLRTWVTNEYEHDGLRAQGMRVLGHLLDLLHGKA